MPAILRSGIWQQLESTPAVPTKALVTDIGNDIVYGFPPEQILAWVDEALTRLARVSDDVVLTDLPMDGIRRLSPAKFHAVRSVFFPSCRLSFEALVATAEQVNAGLAGLAGAHRARFLHLRPSWYGVDPIHIRPSLWRTAWQEVLGVSCPVPPVANRGPAAVCHASGAPVAVRRRAADDAGRGAVARRWPRVAVLGLPFGARTMTRLRTPLALVALFATALITAAHPVAAPHGSRQAAAAPVDRTDEYIRAEMQRQKIPGLSLAVLKDGKIVKIAGYGVADRKSGAAATPETVYKIGSVSKQFIATGIMLLVQEGRLRIDDPVSKYLDGTPPSWSGITIRHLLTHTSGIQREAPAFDPWKVQPDSDVIRSAYPLPLRFPTGSKWEYCNTGYFALAEIISRVSGTPWVDYLRLKVFEPAGMRSTWPTNTTQTLANRATGYTEQRRPARGRQLDGAAAERRLPVDRAPTSRSGRRACIPTRRCRKPRGATCGRRSRSPTAPRIPTASAGPSTR